MKLLMILRQFLEKGHKRSVKAKKNVLLAIVARGLGILIGFAYFPISLAYLSPAKFGIFLTLTSIIDWFGKFDIGIGNGLRNIVGELVADGEDEKARGYISTAYFLLGGIVSGVAIIFMVANLFIPWADWLQTDASLDWDIRVLAMLMFGAFAIRFVSSLIYQIFFALQRVAVVDIFSLVAKLLFLGVIILLTYYTEESLILFGAAKTFTFAFIPLFVGIFYFNTEFKKLRPSFRLVNRNYLGSLLTLGVKFFLIKVSMVVIFQTNNFLIAGFVAVESVAQYQAAHKYLSIFLILFNIIISQLWAANVEAYRKGDLNWMRKTMNSVMKLWAGSTVVIAMMVVAAPLFYHVWLQDKIEIPMAISIIIAISISATTWINIFNVVLNGTGKINLQMYAWLAACVINIPASIFFAKTMGFGLLGIEMGTIASLIPLLFVSPIQVRKILRRKDRGIWAK